MRSWKSGFQDLFKSPMILVPFTKSSPTLSEIIEHICIAGESSSWEEQRLASIQRSNLEVSLFWWCEKRIITSYCLQNLFSNRDPSDNSLFTSKYALKRQNTHASIWALPCWHGKFAHPALLWRWFPLLEGVMPSTCLSKLSSPSWHTPSPLSSHNDPSFPWFSKIQRLFKAYWQFPNYLGDPTQDLDWACNVT